MIPVSDRDAFLQAIQPFTRAFPILRSANPGYDEHGRVDNTRVKQRINAVIVPSNKRINTNSNGMGRWVTADYTLYCVVPEQVAMGDLIDGKEFGPLKVISINDSRWQGVMSASLVRTSTTDPSKSVSSKPYEEY